MLQLNYRDPRPIYEQVKSEFRRLILSGALPRGEKLPSVRELAGSLAINPNTIQRAYRELETEGYICSVPGRGSFVCQQDAALEARRTELLSRFDALVDELALVGVGSDKLIQRLEAEK